jgi:hypothetical protein
LWEYYLRTIVWKPSVYIWICFDDLVIPKIKFAGDIDERFIASGSNGSNVADN